MGSCVCIGATILVYGLLGLQACGPWILDRGFFGGTIPHILRTKGAGKQSSEAITILTQAPKDGSLEHTVYNTAKHIQTGLRKLFYYERFSVLHS